MITINRHTPAPFAFGHEDDIMAWIYYFHTDCDALSSSNTVDGWQMESVLQLCAQFVAFVEACSGYLAEALEVGYTNQDITDLDLAFKAVCCHTMTALADYWRKHYSLFEDAWKRKPDQPLDELMCSGMGILSQQSWYEHNLGFTFDELCGEIEKGDELLLNLALSVGREFALNEYFTKRINAQSRFEAMCICLQVNPQVSIFKDPVTYGGAMAMLYAIFQGRERRQHYETDGPQNARRFVNRVKQIVGYVSDDMQLDDVYVAQALTAFLWSLPAPPGAEGQVEEANYYEDASCYEQDDNYEEATCYEEDSSMF
ncbi:hypothetical protein BD626DRAFT_405678 [Schizophyllum amplum]|uniref:Uncharacterized protein n=1 Tax=Schizophyllum amplum TaxID=97359 RepID=A0A550CA13_9AGAR|nr:hypothetical protein BD626DRAFT_405678 [Auriculariopsis ampla]